MHGSVGSKRQGELGVLICYQRKGEAFTVSVFLLTVLGTYGSP